MRDENLKQHMTEMDKETDKALGGVAFPATQLYSASSLSPVKVTEGLFVEAGAGEIGGRGLPDAVDGEFPVTQGRGV